MNKKTKEYGDRLGVNLLSRTATKEGKRYNCGIAKDVDGYYAMTHRMRSRSYAKKSDIPHQELRKVAETGR